MTIADYIRKVKTLEEALAAMKKLKRQHEVDNFTALPLVKEMLDGNIDTLEKERSNILLREVDAE